MRVACFASWLALGCVGSGTGADDDIPRSDVDGRVDGPVDGRIDAPGPDAGDALPDGRVIPDASFDVDAVEGSPPGTYPDAWPLDGSLRGDPPICDPERGPPCPPGTACVETSGWCCACVGDVPQYCEATAPYSCPPGSWCECNPWGYCECFGVTGCDPRDILACPDGQACFCDGWWCACGATADCTVEDSASCPDGQWCECTAQGCRCTSGVPVCDPFWPGTCPEGAYCSCAPEGCFCRSL